MSATLDYRTVLDAVKAWPAEQRASLAQELMESLPGGARPAQPRQRTAGLAHGLLAGPNPPPDDAEVKRIIEEHRMEKYGR
jgi:hypothetical protein